MSAAAVIGMRWVMRSFLATPPVWISRPVALVSPRAKPKSMRVLVAGLIWAKTWLRYNGTIVSHGHTFTSGPSARPSAMSWSWIGRRLALAAYIASTYLGAFF